jgi:hypothetical protein
MGTSSTHFCPTIVSLKTLKQAQVPSQGYAQSKRAQKEYVWVTGKLMSEQYQETKDLPLPFPQRHRPQVPTEPQACAARHHEGVEGG